MYFDNTVLSCSVSKFEYIRLLIIVIPHILYVIREINNKLEYVYEWNFILGIILFLVGATINIKSDNILLRLRSNKKGYHIPHGFMYKYVSYPNYLGEIIEWLAFALMTWSLAGLSFAVWTIANLIPRAIAGHKWYNKTFENYPKNRKAILPHLL